MKRLGSCTSRLSSKEHDDIVDNNEVDKISELPEPILHHILSLLRTKDAPKTSVLSKTWYSAFNSFPVLDFNENDYFHGDFPDDPSLGQSFYNYVNHSISRRCQDVSIQRFSLRVFLDNLPRPRPLNSGPTYFDEYLDRFINYALSNNVEHLALDYYKMNNVFTYITQTSSLFHPNKSLKVLDLRGFNIVLEEEPVGSIIDDQNIISGGYFSSLKTLNLIKVRVDEQMLRRFLSNACSLEEVSIDGCHGFRSLSLCSPKLTSVYVDLERDEIQEITIEAPNLRSLTLGEQCTDVLSSILDASSKGYAKNLKELQLHRVRIKSAIFRVIHGFSGVLEKLTLKRCVMWRSVRVSSCQLISNSTVKYIDFELIADCRECEKKKKKKKKKGKRSRVEDGLYKLKTK